MTQKIARFFEEQRPQTPCLVIDLDVVEQNYNDLHDALPDARIFYAVKANPAAEILSLLARLGLDELILREARHLLTPDRLDAATRSLGTVDYPLGIIAGDRPIDPVLPRLVLPRPNDGKVSVAATHLAGAADHIVLRVSHTMMLINPRVHRQVIAFLRDGRFHR